MHLSALFVYPVKSLRGIPVSAAHVDALGLVGDRRFMVVDDSGKQLTQRPLPRMTQIETALTESELILHAAGIPSCAIPLNACDSPWTRSVSVWQSTGLVADDCGDSPAEWLTSFLGVSCRLVRAGSKFRRPVLNPERAHPDDLVSFADGYPFLITSEGSLNDLNDRLIARGEEPVPMTRFRPNFIVTGCLPYAEDTWPRIQIGQMLFRAGGPCSRCTVTTTDQITGDRGTEPLRTLATFRRDPLSTTDINFGQNLIHETKSGVIKVGDLVAAL